MALGRVFLWVVHPGIGQTSFCLISKLVAIVRYGVVALCVYLRLAAIIVECYKAFTPISQSQMSAWDPSNVAFIPSHRTYLDGQVKRSISVANIAVLCPLEKEGVKCANRSDPW